MYWYEDKNAERDVYVSSRVRLARNFADYPFEPRLDKAGASEIIEKVKNDLCKNGEYVFTDFSALPRNEKLSMVERHLVSPEFAEKTTPAAIVENKAEGVVVMVCEEDHLRIQSIRAGLDLEGAFEACCKAEEKIDAAEKLAYDEKLGYLTHCPTNLGTGMRASVMMFLPALTLTGRIKGISHQLSALVLTMRGMTGEGSAARGCLYQFSNCSSMGMTEEEILENLKEATAKIAETELRLRGELDKRNGAQLRDRIMRSYGTLKYAYSVTSDEMFRLYSDVRLGICLGYITDMSAAALDELLIGTLPATLTVSAGKDLDPAERDRLRAERIHAVL